jgi:hypothetical protein
VVAIYRAMSDNPNARSAILLLLSGIALQGGAIVLDLYLFRQKGVASSILSILKPIGLQVWCIGLGALVTSLIKDKNLLVPIGIFLVCFDVFLVLTPLGFTQKIMQAAPSILQQGGLSLPVAGSQVSTTGKAEDSGFIGPADLVFLGTFFLATFRFNMRPLLTLRVMIPVLLGYLTFVLGTGISLPALVPIGLVSLGVNWREFKLNKEEWASTGLVTAIMIGILIFSATRPRPVRGRREPSQAPQAQAGSPEKASPDQLQSSAQTVPQNKPSPQ